MASGAKKPTTIAKLRRENAVWERRLRKQAKKHARKQPSEAPAVLPREPSPAMGADPAARSWARSRGASRPGTRARLLHDRCATGRRRLGGGDCAQSCGSVAPP
jgi:hypothetical protein